MPAQRRMLDAAGGDVESAGLSRSRGKYLMRNWRDMDRAEVEAIASGRTSASGQLDVRALGSARAELVRRDQEYAEQQEKIRQEFEREMEKIRTEREKDRQAFDASLAVDSREAARQAARVQSDAAKEAAKLQVAATREVAQRQIRIGWLAAGAAVAAAIAAAASAVAAIIQITMK
jgi:hypothetical protein